MQASESLGWFRAAVVLAAVAGRAWAGDAWEQLKVGMTRNETVAVLGQPVLANQARGFSIQIYDGGAEVVYVRERLATWTAPASSGSVSPAFNPWPRYPASVAPAASRRPAPAAEQRKRPATLPAYRM